jgi:hypothetical protein
MKFGYQLICFNTDDNQGNQLVNSFQEIIVVYYKYHTKKYTLWAKCRVNGYIISWYI